MTGSALPPRSQTVPELTMMRDAATPERQASKRQRTTEPNKLQRRPRTYSFSPGRHDSVRLGRKKSARGQREQDPPFSDRRPNYYATGANADNGMAAMKDEAMWRVPTLRHKREGDHLPRKMSSKKRRKDDQREAEIKAMSAFAPVRPAIEDWMTGRPVKKESRRFRTGFGAGSRAADYDRSNRSSDISLPLPESIDSALSSDSDYVAYKVSAFEVLAPRPTLRYTTHPRTGVVGGLDGSTGLMRRPSPQRRKLAEPIPEETLKAHKRVDSLADDLSASDLRELMERDERRRARKRQLEQERLAQRIARRAEKQKAAEIEAERHGRESPPNLERGVLGREDVGLGIDPASAVVTSSRIRQADATPRPEDHGEGGDEEAQHRDVQSDPLAAFHRVDSIPLPIPAAATESKKTDAPTQIKRASKGSLRKRLSRSRSPQHSVVRTERSGVPPTESESGTPRAARSWASFFRWGSKRKRNSGGPSSFSNTSRDSMQTMTPVPTPTPVATIVPPRRFSSGVPKRTMSRFREDLPELPISPPASRMQSPEADAVRPTIETSLAPTPTAEEPDPSSRPRNDTPVSEQQRQTPSTFSHPDEPGVSPEPQAMSLASIDSEGSWFSSRLSSKKRKSSGILEQSSLPRQTPESDMEPRPEPEANNGEDMYMTDDDYLSRLAPQPHAAERTASWHNRQSAGEARPSSDWDGAEEAQWGSVRGQQPTVVRPHAAERVKSREGLLKTFGDEGEGEIADAADSSGSDGEGEGVGVSGLQRATSIDYGKAHARRISAGSARLLDLTPRSSVDAKRNTFSSMEGVRKSSQ